MPDTGWADSILARIEDLAAISERPDSLTRTYLTPEHNQANERTLAWMRDAGMTARIDEVGNAVGRYEGGDPQTPALMLGSHLDTVRNAGKYDGMLGVVTAIACVGRLHRENRRLSFPIEVVGFANEEGARFGATLTGSRGVAGRLDGADLDARDSVGTTMADAMRQFGLDPVKIGAAARRPGDVAAYVELHIEQGPVLEKNGLPLGVVTAISGATRLRVEVLGLAGHAGTVPMGGRQDALAAAAEAVLAIENRCSSEVGLVGTVGILEARPGAVNVIPGDVRFTVDIRAENDDTRRRAVRDVLAEMATIGARRRVVVAPEIYHQQDSVHCDSWLMDAIEAAIVGEGLRPIRLPSGAGHDAMVLKPLCDVGMMFMRCTAGISHNPVEAVTSKDVDAAAAALYRFITTFAPPRRTPARAEAR
jgi:allantoate deiminase